MAPRKGSPEYEEWRRSSKYEERSKKMSASMKGREASNKGKPMSEEQKKKLKVIANERTNKWTEEEEEILRENYLTLEGPALLKLLPGRSVNAIYPKAKSMGLVKMSETRMSRKEYSQSHNFLSSEWFLPNEGEKACTKCGLIKPYRFFIKVPKGADGYHNYCKPCYIDRYGKDNHKRIHPYTEPQIERFPDGHKRCVTCKEIKALKDFCYDKRNRDGRGACCRECKRFSKEELRKRTLLKYGITPEEYEAMVVEQNGACACCGKPETVLDPKGNIRPLSVDHCHQSNALRGLLCTRCNTALGYMGEDPDRARALLKYIEERCLW